jgi:HTH-type transcriptional regulator, sugar sensing transcriptional regulator
MDAIDLLQQLGFSEYEARAYVALLQRYPVNGYAVAKLANIPRANVYSVLKKLERRGAVVRVETSDGVTYRPVPSDEVIKHLTNRFTAALQSAHQLLSVIGHPVEDNFVQNIEGQEFFLQHARDLIDKASKQLLMGIWLPEAQTLAEATLHAEERGVTYTTLCFQACPEACGNCRRPLYRYRVSQADSSRSLIIVRDNTELLVGTVSTTQTVAIRTKQRRLVEMASWYVRHSIAVAALLQDVGGRLEQQISPATAEIFATLIPGEGWLQSVLSLLNDN